MYREIIAVCSQIQTKHINTLCGQNVELLSVKPGGTYIPLGFKEVNSLMPNYKVNTDSQILHTYRHAYIQKQKNAMQWSRSISAGDLQITYTLSKMRGGGSCRRTRAQHCACDPLSVYNTRRTVCRININILVPLRVK